MFYKTIGDVIVKRQRPVTPEIGDTFFDEDTGSFFIYYGPSAGWLQVSREDLMHQDGC